MFVVPDNHDASSAVGHYRMASTDSMSMIVIYNFFMAT